MLGGTTKDKYKCKCEDATNDIDNATNIKDAPLLPMPHPVRAIVLQPGDVLVMGGESRLNYHAMARVLSHEAALEYDRVVGHTQTATVANGAEVKVDANANAVIIDSIDSCSGGVGNDRSCSIACISLHLRLTPHLERLCFRIPT